ncbi:hypothetical protein NE237_029019 [Protea cynaroides]|uniref:DM2 domain-containing protein n=1 Tax=Protea cynaroides TaxID=273540 RepID=A0A9Q0JUP3_9MAGN|nr:hypothetical protein NE237_029019 [Protea cynaroides]
MSSSRVFRGSQALMAAAKVAKTRAATSSSDVAATKPRAASRNSGILKVTPVSPAMRKFLGVPETSRTEAVKKIWEYIKLNNLQNPTNKREIHCDEKLKTIFDGKEKVDLEVYHPLAEYASHATVAAIGFAARLVGTALSNRLINMKKKMDPSFEPWNKTPPTLLNAFTWGASYEFDQ